MRKRELEAELATLREAVGQMETRRALSEVSDYQRQLAQENKDGFWSSLDSSATKRNRSWTDVEKNLKDAFSAWCVNPLAKSYVDYQRFFVIGKGTEAEAGDGDAAQEMVNLFLNLNEWASLEKKLVEELSRDGEVFVRFHDENRHDMQATVSAISLIDPLEIIDIDAPDVNAPNRYRRKWSEVTWSEDGTKTASNEDEWIDAGEIHHIKINCSHNEQRGRSDLLVNLPWLKQLKGWMDDMSRRNYMSNSFVWDVECSGGVLPSTVTGQYPQGPMPGSVIAHTQNEKWSVNAPDMKWADSTQGARALKLMICAGYKLPESWFGDTGESNLATTTALAMPSLKAFQDRQDFLKEHFEQIISRGARVENVTVTFPEVVGESAKLKAEALAALATALTSLVGEGLLSRESAYSVLQLYVDDLSPWAAQDGELKRIQGEEQSEVMSIAQGSKAGDAARPSLEGDVAG